MLRAPCTQVCVFGSHTYGNTADMTALVHACHDCTYAMLHHPYGLEGEAFGLTTEPGGSELQQGAGGNTVQSEQVMLHFHSIF